MARLTLYFCDLCGEPTKEELGHTIVLCKTEHKDSPHSGFKESGDICEKCYKALLGTLEQEAEPVLPRAVKSTPSEKAKPPTPSLDLSGIIQGSEQVVGKAQTVTYDGPPTHDLMEGEMNIQPSTFTLEKKRAYLKKQREAGCQHSSGYSMSEDGNGFTCLDCRKTVKVNT